MAWKTLENICLGYNKGVCTKIIHGFENISELL